MFDISRWIVVVVVVLCLACGWVMELALPLTSLLPSPKLAAGLVYMANFVAPFCRAVERVLAVTLVATTVTQFGCR